MTERAAALATLSAIASSPDAVGESPAHLFAALDAIAVVYASADTANLNPAQVALRSPTAVWTAVRSHAENRVANLKRIAAAKAAA